MNTSGNGLPRGTSSLRAVNGWSCGRPSSRKRVFDVEARRGRGEPDADAVLEQHLQEPVEAGQRAQPARRERAVLGFLLLGELALLGGAQLAAHERREDVAVALAVVLRPVIGTERRQAVAHHEA